MRAFELFVLIMDYGGIAFIYLGSTIKSKNVTIKKIILINYNGFD